MPSINVPTLSNYNSVIATPSINHKDIQLLNALEQIYDPLLLEMSNYKSQSDTITNEILNELSNCDMNYHCVTTCYMNPIHL